jgi:3',5'-cyclic AMP phosphodiesterase CpdA
MHPRPLENSPDALSSYRQNNALAALPRLKIVHLSDLHFVTHSILRHCAYFSGLNGHDVDTITALENAVTSLKPDLLFATGDHATWGDKTSLSYARTFLLNLAERMGLAAERVHWIPGNHDVLLHYYIRIPFRRRPHDRIFGVSSPAKFTTVAGYKVAIFSFDSTLDRSKQWSPVWPLVGSRGTVSRHAFNQFNEAIHEQHDRDEYFKIAQIHHHPLPIPYKGAGDAGIELTTMTNGGTFIAYMQESGMNLVLHGHEHFPYSCQYCFDPNQTHLIIAAAGSAGQKGSAINSFNYLEVVPRNRIIVNEYKCSEVGFRRDLNSTKIFTFLPKALGDQRF